MVELIEIMAGWEIPRAGCRTRARGNRDVRLTLNGFQCCWKLKTGEFHVW
jgi:hypothetical protein